MQRLRVRDSGNKGGHGGEVFSCVYSYDGVFVLSVGWDGSYPSRDRKGAELPTAPLRSRLG